MNKIMRVVLVEPGKKAVVKAIDGSLEGMQKTVGGYIEAIALDDQGTCLVCNENGKIDTPGTGSPTTPWVTKDNPQNPA